MSEFENQADTEYFIKKAQAAGVYFKDDLGKTKISKEILDKIPKDLAAKYRMIPICIDRDDLVLVTDNPQVSKNIQQIKEKVGSNIKILLTSADNIKMGLLTHFNITNYREKNANSTTNIEVDTTPLKRKINEMIQDAAGRCASDIHILPYNTGVFVHFRINGHLIDVSDIYQFAASEAINVINIIKGMDTSGKAETTKSNVPNSGSFTTKRGDTPIYVRIATVPIGTETGPQKVNLRLLPQNNRRVEINDIGYPRKDLYMITKTLYQSASGLFINSGPTGSGKTTSLYAQMYYIEDSLGEPLNIMCIENPIEIKEGSFTQVQVHEADDADISLTAKKILKVGLRSDPDIFLYGEIRDGEDARVAIEASTTGHRVFSTVHAADCIRTITRLLDLDVSKTSLLSELKMIISQRLVGVLCPECSKPHEITRQEKAILSEEEYKELTAPGVYLKERGPAIAQSQCKNHCNFGLQGRTVVDEYVIFDTALRDMLLQQKSFSEVKEILKKRGFKSMWEKGLEMVKSGQVELSEIIHVVGKD